MSKIVVITGAAGNLGTKLRGYFASLGWELRLLDQQAGTLVQQADFSAYDEEWAKTFSDADAVIHLAADPSPRATPKSVYYNNILATENVLKAALRHRAQRVIFASSNWVLAGYRFAADRLTTDLPPYPVNPYGVSKMQGESLGRFAVAEGLPSFLALRIGYCASGENRAGLHMDLQSWGQLMWLSNRDLCKAIEHAVLCDHKGFDVVNLMSNNPGMRWDIEKTQQILNYMPQDGAAAVTNSWVTTREWMAKVAHRIWEGMASPIL